MIERKLLSKSNPITVTSHEKPGFHIIFRLKSMLILSEKSNSTVRLKTEVRLFGSLAVPLRQVLTKT